VPFNSSRIEESSQGKMISIKEDADYCKGCGIKNTHKKWLVHVQFIAGWIF
jgi:hypothetical protein